MAPSRNDLDNNLPTTEEPIMFDLPPVPIGRINETADAASRRIPQCKLRDLPVLPEAVQRGLDIARADYRDKLKHSRDLVVGDRRCQLTGVVNEQTAQGRMLQQRTSLDRQVRQLAEVRDNVSSRRKTTLREAEAGNEEAESLRKNITRSLSRLMAWLFCWIWRRPINHLVRQRIHTIGNVNVSRIEGDRLKTGEAIAVELIGACKSEISRLDQAEYSLTQLIDGAARPNLRVSAEVPCVTHWQIGPTSEESEKIAQQVFPDSVVPNLAAQVVRRWASGADMDKAVTEVAQEVTCKANLPGNIDEYLTAVGPERRRSKLDVSVRQAVQTCPVKRLNAPGLTHRFEVRLLEIPGGEGSPLCSELRAINPEAARQRVVDNWDYDPNAIQICMHEVNLYPAQCAELISAARIAKRASDDLRLRAVTVWPEPEEVTSFWPELAAESQKDGRRLLLKLGAVGFVLRDGSARYIFANGHPETAELSQSNGEIGKGWTAAVAAMEANNSGMADAVEAALTELTRRLGHGGLRRSLREFRNNVTDFVPRERIEEAIRLVDEEIALLDKDKGIGVGVLETNGHATAGAPRITGKKRNTGNGRAVVSSSQR